MKNSDLISGWSNTLAALRCYTQSRGVALSAELENQLTIDLVGRIKIAPADKPVVFVDANGKEHDLLTHVLEKQPVTQAKATDPNPFSRESWNLTRQYVIQNANPEMAGRMQCEASGPTPETTEPNPFLLGKTWNLTQQMMLEIKNPALAAELKQKA
jgi:hypothetical protein